MRASRPFMSFVKMYFTINLREKQGGVVLLNVPDHVQALLAALRDAGFEAYPVGGCVRDSLMGRTPSDWDLCTAATPAQTEAALAGYRLIETGVKHGTVTALTERGPVEITTFRTDGEYLDHRRPEHVTFVPDLREDLARRDFTVNAMALDPSGSVVDPFGGRTDLAAGIIRCVGEPDRRFGEDALRILRALRFAAKHNFSIDPATGDSAVKNRALLDDIARERVFAELTGLLTGPGAGRVLREYAPIIFQIIPELAPQAGFDQKNPNHIHDIWTHTTMAVDAAPPEPVLRLTMLLHDVGKPACFFTDEAGVGHYYGHGETGAEIADDILRRLRCDNATRERVCLLIRNHDIKPPQTPRAARRLLARLGEDGARQLIACWRADNADRGEAVRVRNLALIDDWEKLLAEALAGPAPCFSVKSLAVKGQDIMVLGIPEGPEVGRVLAALFDAVTDGEVPNEREALLHKALVISREKD